MNSIAGTAPITTPFDSAERDLDVMVGFDGSEHAQSALHFAAVEALSRGIGLTVVTAFSVPLMIYPNMASLPAQPEDQFRRELAEKTLSEARESLREYPGKSRIRDHAGRRHRRPRRTFGSGEAGRRRSPRSGRLRRADSRDRSRRHSPPMPIAPPSWCPVAIRRSRPKAPSASPTERPTPLSSLRSMDPSRVAWSCSRRHSRPNTAAASSAYLRRHAPDRRRAYWYPELYVDESSTKTRRSELEESIEAELSWLQELHPSVDITAEVAVGEPISLIAAKTRCLLSRPSALAVAAQSRALCWVQYHAVSSTTLKGRSWLSRLRRCTTSPTADKTGLVRCAAPGPCGHCAAGSGVAPPHFAGRTCK